MGDTRPDPRSRNDAVVMRPNMAEAVPTCSASRHRQDRFFLSRSCRPTACWNVWCCLLALVLAGLAAGCGGTPAIVHEMTPEDLAAAPSQSGFQYVDRYLIQVGDRMRIEFLSDPEPSTNASEVTVRPDGRISLRGVDDVLAAGVTPAELDSVLTRQFARLLVDPELSVIVESFSREKVYVLGEVERPREIELNGPITLLQAISAAGGYLTTANLGNIVVVRPLPDGQVAAMKVDMLATAQAGKTAAPVVLHAQDVVIVPRTAIAKVGVFVEQYFENLNPALLTAFWVDRIYTK